VSASRAGPRELTQTVRGHALFIRHFEAIVVDGRDRNARGTSRGDELTIGAAEGNDLRLGDGAVSRHHCVLRSNARGLELRDLNSTNGTFLNDTEIVSAYIVSGTRIRVGETTLAIRVLDTETEHPLAAGDRMGDLIGGSAVMRRLYPLIERCAKSESTVLINGETGTGKELVAEAIHEASARREQPFVVLDCGALPHELAESELFGHVRGAFTGADAARPGAFETADHGTIFLDEIGELPLALQPLLLRVLENGTVRRLGSNDYRRIDVRVIAASHRDLRSLVNERRFRPDLYYRLNVLALEVPPLRERSGDIALLAEHFWREFRPDVAAPRALVEQLAAQSWPGNVRELRNAVERASLIGWRADAAPPETRTYEQAKEVWERAWLEQLMRTHGGNLSRAARTARMGRSHLRERIRRYGFGGAREPE
jgi:two-component system response regulator GlrR